MTESEAIETLIGIRLVSGYSKSREEALDMAIAALEKQEGEGGLTMAEYIEREAAVAIIEEKQKELCPLGRYSRTMVYGSDRDRFDSWQEMINSIEDIPAADVVEVVRCKDCKWFGLAGCAIQIVDDTDKQSEDDFCSFGERKGGDE